MVLHLVSNKGQVGKLDYGGGGILGLGDMVGQN